MGPVPLASADDSVVLRVFDAILVLKVIRLVGASVMMLMLKVDVSSAVFTYH